MPPHFDSGGSRARSKSPRGAAVAGRVATDVERRALCAWARDRARLHAMCATHRAKGGRGRRCCLNRTAGARGAAAARRSHTDTLPVLPLPLLAPRSRRRRTRCRDCAPSGAATSPTLASTPWSSRCGRAPLAGRTTLRPSSTPSPRVRAVRRCSGRRVSGHRHGGRTASRPSSTPRRCSFRAARRRRLLPGGQRLCALHRVAGACSPHAHSFPPGCRAACAARALRECAPPSTTPAPIVCVAFLRRLPLQAKVDATYKDQAKWTRMSILSTAGMGKFSTDRTIAEYAHVSHSRMCTDEVGPAERTHSMQPTPYHRGVRTREPHAALTLVHGPAQHAQRLAGDSRCFVKRPLAALPARLVHFLCSRRTFGRWRRARCPSPSERREAPHAAPARSSCQLIRGRAHAPAPWPARWLLLEVDGNGCRTWRS